MREGERPQEQRVDGAEDRGVGADADGEREHGDGGEGRRAAEGAEREARVLHCGVENGESGHGARLLGECDVRLPKLLARGEARVLGRERAARGVLALHRVEREMEVHLLVELARVVGARR